MENSSKIRNKGLIEIYWEAYIKMVKLDKMGPHQRIELKRAFFGASGMMLKFFTQSIPDYPDDVAVTLLKKADKEVSEFFIEQINQQNVKEN